MKDDIVKTSEADSVEVIKNEKVGVKKSAEKPSKTKITAFTLFEQFNFNYANSCVRIGGVLHIWDMQKQCYCKADKDEIVSFLMRNYYNIISQTGTLRIAKACAEIIMQCPYTECYSAEQKMILCLANGYLDFSAIEKTFFYDYNYNKFNPVPTFLLNCNGFPTMTNWSAAKELPTPWMDSYLRSAAYGIPQFQKRFWEMLGYLIAPDRNGKCFFVLQGVPNSGKSLIGRFLQVLFPQNRIANLDIDQLNKQKSTENLINKSINISMDLPNKALAPSAIRNIKLITGNDTITVEHKNGEYKTYDISCKFLFATNHALTLRGADSGLEERMVCIPFTCSIPEANRMPNLLDKLLEEGGFIVAKALAYYIDLRKRNYIFSGSESSIFKPRIRYLPIEAEDIDANLCEFIENNCAFVSQEKGMHTEDLYRAYCQFCKENNETPINNVNSFSRRLLTCYGDRLSKDKWRKKGEEIPKWGFLGILIQPMKDI